jgi:hypothetical protein
MRSRGSCNTMVLMYVIGEVVGYVGGRVLSRRQRVCTSCEGVFNVVALLLLFVAVFQVS